tara:strand:+ start:1147 stop:2091 length:945 start_codon:yes stop_codon:yes gene_type:complete
MINKSYFLDSKKDIIFYKEAEKIKQFLKYKNHTHIIIYGTYGIGKTTLINNIIENTFGNLYELERSDKIIIKSNQFSYYFDFLKIIDKDYFFNYLKQIVSSYDHYNDHLKYIILDNYQNANIIIQRNLKVILEKYYKTSRFIILTNKIQNVDFAIKSRCFLFRLKKPNHHDKYIYIKNFLVKNNIIVNDFLLKKDCEKYNIDRIINKNIHGDYIDYVEIITIDILDIIYSPFDLKRIKLLSSKIKEINMNLNEIINNFSNKINIIIGNQNVPKLTLLIKEIANINHIIQGSYREIIHIESFIIQIYNIINFYDN